MKYLFIINPVAGKSNSEQTLVPRIQAAAKSLGIQAEIEHTQFSGHAIQLAKQAAQSGEPIRLYACGGDGTLNEVLCGAYTYPNAEVGHIPCGSGNDMIRNYGNAQEFLDLENMLTGESKIIDLIEVNGRAAASICAAGLDAKVAYNIPLFRRIPLCGGSMAYDLSVLKCLMGKLGYHMTVECEEAREEGDYLLVAIGNGSYYGGGYHSVPGAETDDGLLNVVLVKKMSLLRIAPILNRYKAGTHFAGDGTIAEDLQDVISTFATKEITLSCDKEFYYTIDGECAATKKIKVKVLPAAARFILPKGLPPL